MTNTLSRFICTFIFVLLALMGMSIALVFIASIAIAIVLLYVVVKLCSKTLGKRAHWSQRYTGQDSFKTDPSTFEKTRRPDIVDVEARRIH